MNDKCLESSRDNDTINQSDVNRFKTNEINDPSEKTDNMDSEKEIEIETETNQSGSDAEKNEYRKNSAFSFTIDFGGGKTVDNRKLKEMAERFQSRQQRQQEQRRHRRGVSLSKLNDISIEASKRHSWSPCSSQERITNTSDQNFEHNETICAETELKSPKQFQPKSATLRSAMQNISLGATTAIEINERPQSDYKASVKKTFDEELITTPLEYIRSSDDEGSIGLVSEAGTYTVDGDNYTEEEKERMSIDAMGKRHFELPIDAHNFNDNLNTFQGNYRRVETTKVTTKCSENKNPLKKESMIKSPKTTVKFGQVCYIDKSKIQVKSLVAHPPTKTKNCSESDHGVFTSITACGVLDMQTVRKPSPKLPSRKCRRNSLTKLQIDSSEYIQPKIIQNSSYTDNEKAQHNEYQLNIFSNTSSYTSLASTPQTDDEVLSVECIENISNSIKTAQTKNDWIQEWAKNARRRNNLISSSLSNTLTEQDSSTNVCSPRQIERIKQTRDRRMTQSFDVSYSNNGGASQPSDIDYYDKKIVPSNISRPPISPTKIPSPRHTQHRVRSSSANRMLYNTDFQNFDVDKYIAKTTSSKLSGRTNSPDNLISPNARHGSPPLKSSALIFNYESPQMKTHKRNLSLDISNKVNSKTNPIDKIDKLPKRHTRHNSYENKQIQLCELNSQNIDQTISSHNNNTRTSNRKDSHTSKQNSYEKKVYGNAATSTAATGISYKRLINRNARQSINASPKSNDRTSDYRQSDTSPCSSLYKSNESEVYHINDNDDLRISNDDILSSPDTDDNPKKNTNDFANQISSSDKILSNTRYNKAFRMRMEQNKQITSTNQGVSACPNTPEMTRRSSKARSSFRDTTSMPRDSSLTRLKTELQNFQTTKKNLKQPTPKPTVTTAVTNNPIKQRVQPKYLDISKYKPIQGQSFLKRDESKSTLVNRSEMKKSPSAVGLSRNDTARSSIRVKSAGTPTSTRDSKAREQELLMWRRRATYDPMKAAAEGKKKQLEEAKKSVQRSGPLNSGNTAVLRSQSFHNGTMQFGDFQLRQQFSEDSLNRIHWTMTSTESSEEEEFGDNE